MYVFKPQEEVEMETPRISPLKSKYAIWGKIIESIIYTRQLWRWEKQ